MGPTDRIRYLLEYALVRGVEGAFRHLPDAPGRALGRGVGALLGLTLRSRTRKAVENLAQSFPEAPAGQVARWARECWANIGQAAWEFARFPRLDDEEFARRIPLEGVEGVKASLGKGRGAIFFTAHYANWESQARRTALAGFPMAVIGRRIKNPLVNDLVVRRRAESNVRVLLHKDAVKESLRWLKQGKVLGLLIDQRITDGGTRIPFFGRPAFTTILPAFLALRLECPIHPIRTVREGAGLRMIIEPAVDTTGLRSREEDVRTLSTRLNEIVEGWVRERPPMWLWIHDRWKQ